MSLRAALATLITLLLGTAAATTGRADDVQINAYESLSLHVHTIKELRLLRAFSRTVHQQYDFSCGSAAVATLLTYHYGQPTDEATVFKAMFAAGDQAQIRSKGFSMLDMKRFLESQGYTADGVRASLDTLASVNIPAIALVAERGYRHFVVVKGVQGKRVVVGDPALGTRILARRDFEASRVGNLFFVIRSHRNRAQFNAQGDWGSRLAAPLFTGVDRSSLALEVLDIPDASRF